MPVSLNCWSGGDIGSLVSSGAEYMPTELESECDGIAFLKDRANQ
jgi:hypothetical protein